MTKAPKRAAKSAKPKKARGGGQADLLALDGPGTEDTAVKRGGKKAGATAGKAQPKKVAAKKTTAKKSATKKNRPKAIAQAAPPPAELLDVSADVLDRLFEVVSARRTADPAISHSARLLSRGTAKVAQKFGEEAVECLIEAVAGNSGKLIGESADVLYHLIVMWVDAGLRPGEVWAELVRREGTSGIAEKASRRPEPTGISEKE
jgi:phosphoribosyl-ATP pyrophosphohydrolase